MIETGRYCQFEHGYDLDEKINEVAELTQKFIAELKQEVGKEDYKKIAKVIIQEHLNQL